MAIEQMQNMITSFSETDSLLVLPIDTSESSSYHPFSPSIKPPHLSLFCRRHHLLSLSGIVYLAALTGSGSADQLSMRTGGVCPKISYESETCLFPVQRGGLYGSPELPQILSGSARYPVQRVPG